MIFHGEPYVTLMASLPAVGPLLSRQATPINRLRLQGRLQALAPDDRRDLAALYAILDWASFDLDLTDAALVTRARRVIASLRSDTLKAAARDWLEIRTLVAALRRRQAGEDAPPAGELWGYGRFVATIRTNWGAPDFGVARPFPWVLQAKEKLEAGEVTALEQIVLRAIWAVGDRHALGHYFDFEAVAFYQLRWSVVDRWARYDADEAAARFEDLLDAAFDEAALPLGAPA